MAGRISYYGNIVKDGLVLDLDAAKRDSYPGTGTAWNDISGFRNNGTLTNGPSFNSANGGSIVFDGSNDYVITPSTTYDFSTNANFTYCAWIYPNFNSSLNSGKAVIDFTSPTYTRSYLRWEGTSLGFYFDIAVSGGGSAWRTSSIPTFSANTWNYICFTHDSSNVGNFYFNGSIISTTRLFNGASTVTNNSITIGYGAVNSYYWSGGISTVQIYNRALSATEVLQNYNATKGRYL